MTLGLAVTACTFALVVTPALAHEFTASKTGKTTGTGVTAQALKFGPFKITCEKAVAKGAVVEGSSKTYAASIKFVKCGTEAKIANKKIALGTRFLTPLAIEYHANGFVETGSEIEEVEGKAVLAGGTTEVKVNTGIKSTCTISWPEQTLPLRAEKKPELEYSSAEYLPEETAHLVSKSFPDGFQHFIQVVNTFKGIKYEFAGEPCEEWGKEEGPEGAGGTYTGSFPQKLAAGNLEFN
jgi:hypothetical protein